MPQILAELVL